MEEGRNDNVTVTWEKGSSDRDEGIEMTMSL